MPAVLPGPKLAPPASRRWRDVAWVTVAAAGLVLLCSRWYGPDIWYHLALGDRILATGDVSPADHLIAPPARFINLYWLFQITISAIYRIGGIGATSLWFGLVWVVAFALWVRTSGAWRAGAWGAFAVLASLLVCQPRFDPRPEVVSYALLALQVSWLATGDFSGRPTWRTIAGFALTEAVWANVHGYFALGPLLVGARLLAALVAPTAGSGEDSRRGGRALAGLLGATLLATVISPLGWHTWECVVLLTKTLRELRLDIQEFYPPTQVNLRLWTVKVFWLYWAFILLGAVVTLARAPRRSCFALLTAVAGLVLSAGALRNLPLLVFLSAPIMAEILPGLPRGRRAVSGVGAATALAASALAGWAVSGGFYESLRSPSAFGVGEAPGAYPARFAGYLRAGKFDGALFNAARDGGYLEFHAPALRLYGDSRFVDPAPVRDYFAAVADPGAFRRLDAQVHFDAVLLPLDLSRDVIGTLLQDPAWKLAYGDLHRAFLVRANSRAAALGAAPQLEFYRGEDLASVRHSAFAAQWIVILTLASDRPHLLLALQQLAAAPAIPSFVGEFALRFAHGTGDGEIVRLVRALRGKFHAASPADQQELDNAFAATAAL
jgi:hypothetical protein